MCKLSSSSSAVQNSQSRVKREKKQADVDEVVTISTSRGLTQERAIDAIARLKSAGQIYEPSYRKLDVIR